MKDVNKKVSIIIPTYNRADVLCRALDSVLSQSYQDFEVIIVDDGSTDNTKDVLAFYLEEYPQLKYFYQENSGSPAIARNFGIMQASGEYINFLDSDDWYLSGRLNKMVDFIERNNCDWVICSSYRCDDDAFDDLKLIKMNERYLNESGKGLDLLKYGLFSFTSMPIFTGAVLIKKECFDTVGLFDDSYLVGEDSDMWLRLAESDFKCGYLNTALFVYCKNRTSITNVNMLPLDENIRLAKNHLKLIKCDKRILRKSYSDFLWEYAQIYYFKGKRIYGIFLLFKSFIVFPELRKILNISKHFHKCFF